MSKKFFALLMLGVLSVGAAGIVSGQDPAPVPVPVPCDGTGCDGLPTLAPTSAPAATVMIAAVTPVEASIRRV